MQKKFVLSLRSLLLDALFVASRKASIVSNKALIVRKYEPIVSNFEHIRSLKMRFILVDAYL